VSKYDRRDGQSAELLDANSVDDMQLIEPMDDADDKYGHVRAYLSALQREHNSKSPTDGADDPDPSNAGLAARIASLLVEDKEDEVKNLLVEKLGIQETSVSPAHSN
jgi:hypothetical protein